MAFGGRLSGLDRGDLGTDQRAIDEIERQHVDTAVVAARLEIPARELVREIGALVRRQVDREECDLTDEVAVAQLAVELERIEGHDCAVAPREVLEVQVSVTFAMRARSGSPREDGVETLAR